LVNSLAATCVKPAKQKKVIICSGSEQSHVTSPKGGTYL
jgi:hypothetical protein